MASGIYCGHTKYLFSKNFQHICTMQYIILQEICVYQMVDAECLVWHLQDIICVLCAVNCICMQDILCMLHAKYQNNK
jgi:hypothetical protein